jgi:hypothetical protein
MSRSKTSQKQAMRDDAVRLLGQTVSKQEAEIDELRRIINERDNAIVGYKAVISYLEFQSGMRGSQ